MDRHYTKEFKLMVAREATRPEFENIEHVIAKKYSLRVNTLMRWKKLFVKYGEQAFVRGFRPEAVDLARGKYLQRISELEEEVEVLKKAAAFLAKVNRE